ncbi:MAG: hypothetical protein EBV07_00905, partial [Proteobacteria bacterium]|nr:hypothetical protein [Pseudomonadota bacterium]
MRCEAEPARAIAGPEAPAHHVDTALFIAVLSHAACTAATGKERGRVGHLAGVHWVVVAPRCELAARDEHLVGHPEQLLQELLVLHAVEHDLRDRRVEAAQRVTALRARVVRRVLHEHAVVRRAPVDRPGV